MLDHKIEEARNKDLLSYVISRGAKYSKSGNKYFISSPFSRDSNWSLCIYANTNSFFDYSTGIGGDIISFVRQVEGLTFLEAVDHLSDSKFKNVDLTAIKTDKDESFWKEFDYTRFLTHDPEEIKKIKSYAASRGITGGYECGVFFTKNKNNKWVRNPSIMFLHKDLDSTIVGAKFRKISTESPKEPRFSHRGKSGFYILENIVEGSYEKPVLFLVESESSSNSLWEYFKSIKKNAIIISFGGVSQYPKEVPSKYSKLKLKLIIDYDGNLKLYKKRLKNYEHLNAEPVKLILPKGEDINSLYVGGKINLLNNLF